MKLGILVCLATAFVLFVVPAYAQTNTNLMGLSADPIEPIQCIEGPGMQVYTAHLFVYWPINEDFNGGEVRDVEWISGFECRIWLEGAGILLGWHFPVNAIDAGTNGNTIVGFAEPVPVTSKMVILGTLEIFLEYTAGQPELTGDDVKLAPAGCDNPTANVYMAPIRPVPSVAGMMAYLDADDTDNPLVGAGLYGSFQDDLVLKLEAKVVANEAESWGSVKALYR